jgi:hypothetical protein
MELCEPLQEFRRTLPPAFAGTAMGRLTGDGYNYRSLLNEISRGEAPRDIIIKQGNRKNLIVRDKFLVYWQSKLTVSEEV